MKSQRIGQIILAATLAIGIVGCGSGSAPEEKEVTTAATQMTGLGDAARKAGGNFDSLPEADKQKFLERVGGDEKAARDMVTRMAGGGGPRGAGSQ